MSANLYDLFHARFADTAQRLFLEDQDGARWTYGDLDDLTARAAAGLAAHEVRAGDRVAVVAHKTPLTVVTYLACLRLGATFVPIDPAYPVTALVERACALEPAILVVGSELATDPRLGAATRLTLDADGTGSLAAGLLGTGERRRAVAEVAADAPAAILFTSGTTGRPKGAILSHHNLAVNAIALHRAWRFRGGDVLTHVLPIFHAHGLFVALHTSMLNATPILFRSAFDVDATIDDLARSSVFMGVPTHYTRMLRSPRLDATSTRAIRLFVSGSAPLPTATWQAFRDRTGHEILERYGMTETGMISSNPYDGPRLPGSVGYALDGVETRIVEQDGRDVGPARRERDGDDATVDDVGVLEVRGPSVSRGYWRQVNADAHGPDGWFHTGDLARIDDDGRITLVGRSTDLVITGGLNVRPVEVERVLDEIAAVHESAVIGLPHPDLGEAVTAFVVADVEASDTETLDAQAIRAATADTLPGYKVPKVVCFVDELPRNSMGKVDRRALRTRYEHLYQPSGPSPR